MRKDSYLLIIAEISKIIKKALGLRKRTMQVREKIGKQSDSLEIKKLRKKIGI